MQEVWKDIDGYEGLYQISNFGNVMSLKYRGGSRPKLLVPKCNNTGRLWVELRKHRKGKPFLIHRLVAAAFIDNPNNYPQINHIDENPRNNHVDNLEWCTCLYNIRSYMNNHPDKQSKRKNSPIYNRHMDSKVSQYSTDGMLLKVWSNPIEICNAHNWNEWSIIQCCKGKRKTAYGYIWRYAD